MRSRAAQKRWVAVRKLIDAHAPRRPEREREIAAANIRYFLSATTWNYYRLYFGFSPDKAIECAQTALRQAVDALGPPRKARGAGRHAGIRPTRRHVKSLPMSTSFEPRFRRPP